MKCLTFNVLAMFAICLLALSVCSETSALASPSISAANKTSSQTSQQTTTSTNPRASSSSLRVSFIDVGKGDCILAQTGNSSVIIDTGYGKTGDNVLSYLQDLGISHLDALIVTHYDRDHVGGISKIGAGVDVGTIYLPGYVGSDENYRSCIADVKALGVQTRQVTKKLTISMGNAHLTIYPSSVSYEPGADGDEGNDNDVSLVATITNGRDSFLFAGDLEEEGIDAYLRSNHGQFDVVKMPHHGRRSSNTADFLDDVCPQIAIITDSKKDQADKTTLKLLEKSEVQTYRTSTDGSIIVESNGTGSYSVSTSND